MILGEKTILDEIDRRLVKELQADAKISLKKVGRKGRAERTLGDGAGKEA